MKHIFNKLQKSVFIYVGVGIIFCMLFIFTSLFILKTQGRIFIENAVVSGPIISLAPTTAGRLKTVLVQTGDKIKKGDQLAIVGTDVIRSYTDGIVIETNKQLGSFVTQQSSIIKMIDINELRIDGTIDENKGLNKLKIGQTVSFTIDALPKHLFWGYIDEIAPTAKQTQLTFSISSERPTQQFDVYIHFDAFRYPEIKNGMSSKLTVFTNMY